MLWKFFCTVLKINKETNGEKRSIFIDEKENHHRHLKYTRNDWKKNSHYESTH